MLESIYESVRRGDRLNSKDAMALLDNGDFMTLGALAHERRLKMHPEKRVTFVIDRNINYTNVCASKCLFCAFYKEDGEDGGYVITKEELSHKIEETIALGGTQILLQGGMNPNLPLSFYEDMLTFMKETYKVHVHGFSPPEITYLAEQNSLSVEEVIKRLVSAGLDSIPGGGAEILSDDIRGQVSPNKCGADAWLHVMKTAHQQGLKSSATMMFGHVESNAHIIEHLMRLRDLQDETRGFTAFIPWTFQPNNTQIEVTPKTSAEYLRVLALSRLVLDNIPNIQASWVTQGDKIAQTALFFGANDMGSTMIEENVVAAAGVSFLLPMSEMIGLIEKAGYTAYQRDCYYNLLKNHTDLPDA